MYWLSPYMSLESVVSLQAVASEVPAWTMFFTT